MCVWKILFFYGVSKVKICKILFYLLKVLVDKQRDSTTLWISQISVCESLLVKEECRCCWRQANSAVSVGPSKSVFCDRLTFQAPESIEISIVFKATTHLRDTDKHHHKSACSVNPKCDVHSFLARDTLLPGFTNFKFYSAEQNFFFSVKLVTA